MPLSVVIGRGHNNDKGIFKIGGLRDLIETDNVVGLADRGYEHSHLIRPDDTTLAKRMGLPEDTFSSLQAKYRSPVEIMNTIAKFFSFAAKKVSQSPEFQAYGLMVVYYLSSLMMESNPSFFVTRLLNK